MPPSSFHHTGLPRHDVPIDAMRFTSGHVGRVRQRGVVGTTNRRAYYNADVAPLLRNFTETCAGSSAKLATAVSSIVSRSRSALEMSDGGKSFNISSGGGGVASDLGPQNATVVHMHPHPCGELLDTLHYRPQRSYTPESFFFDSQMVGAGGQLTKKPAALEPSYRSQSVLSGGSQRLHRTPAPLPQHSKLLANLKEPPAGVGTQPVVGTAGYLAPATACDTSIYSLAKTSVAEPRINRHLVETPSMDASFSACASQTASTSRKMAASPLSGDGSHSTACASQQRQFFVSRAGWANNEQQSTMPNLPDAPKPKLRIELTDFHDTSSVTQVPANAGQYASEAQRFASYNRGLGASLRPQQEQASAAALADLRAKKRNANETRVVAACLKRDGVELGRKEQYIATRHNAAVGAFRMERHRFEESIRLQEEMDARSAASVNRGRSSPGTTEEHHH